MEHPLRLARQKLPARIGLQGRIASNLSVSLRLILKEKGPQPRLRRIRKMYMIGKNRFLRKAASAGVLGKGQQTSSTLCKYANGMIMEKIIILALFPALFL